MVTSRRDLRWARGSGRRQEVSAFDCDLPAGKLPAASFDPARDLCHRIAARHWPSQFLASVWTLIVVVQAVVTQRRSREALTQGGHDHPIAWPNRIRQIWRSTT